MKLKSMTQTAGMETNAAPLKRIAMRMNAKKMIPVLRKDLYSNPKQTMIQEYLSNARDAHRQAGNLKTPIKVVLPTRLDSNIRIRDYGISMSPEQIETVFGVMGNSSKDNNDDDIGGFGLGSKSALAYVDSFTFITYYNKVMRTYVCHIGENPEGDLDLHDESPTEEPNGVEIQIGIQEKDIEYIRQAVYRATMFWDVKPEIGGILADEIPSFYKKVEDFCVIKHDNWKIFKAEEINRYIEGQDYYSHNGGIILLVGGIPYRLSSHFMGLENVQRVQKYLNRNMTLTVNVSVKDVEINPNRENLMASDFSKEKVNVICEKVVGSIMEKISNEISTSKNFSQFLTNHTKINRTLNESVENAITLGGTEYKLDRNNLLKSTSLAHARIECYTLNEQRNGKIVSREDTRNLYISRDGDTKIVYMDIEEGPNHTRERMRNYFNGDVHKKVYVLRLANAVPANPAANLAGFTPDAKIFNSLLSEIEAGTVSSLPLPVVEKGERAKRASNKGKLCIHFLEGEEGNRRHSLVLRRNSEHFLPEEIDDTQKYLYIEYKDGGLPEKYDSGTLAKVSKYLEGKGYTLIGVSPQVKAKVLELELEIESYDSFLANFSKNLPLTATEQNYMKKKAWTGISRLDKIVRLKNKIEDESIVELIDFNEQMLAIENEGSIPAEIQEFYKKEKEGLEKEVVKMKKQLEKAEKDYPLVWQIDRYSPDHNGKVGSELVVYMNFKYNNK